MSANFASLFKILDCNMHPTLVQDLINLLSQGFYLFGSEKVVVSQVKSILDRKYGRNWTVVIGLRFACCFDQDYYFGYVRFMFKNMIIDVYKELPCIYPFMFTLIANVSINFYIYV